MAFDEFDFVPAWVQLSGNQVMKTGLKCKRTFVQYVLSYCGGG